VLEILPFILAAGPFFHDVLEILPDIWPKIPFFAIWPKYAGGFPVDSDELRGKRKYTGENPVRADFGKNSQSYADCGGHSRG
jgi:hypothetical protein